MPRASPSCRADSWDSRAVSDISPRVVQSSRCQVTLLGLALARGFRTARALLNQPRASLSLPADTATAPSLSYETARSRCQVVLLGSAAARVLSTARALSNQLRASSSLPADTASSPSRSYAAERSRCQVVLLG